ncbi:hypothetical protein NPIL_334401 [Nephila pilipes]|uniref:Uncharacterized protein n=1 Tax=Nephila pilipes TaxID=299642 RepID=A0A8X6NNJ4_NEPPI|nr:hypothetical protein NPIL_334401 [Nephila pilipes]
MSTTNEPKSCSMLHKKLLKCRVGSNYLELLDPTVTKLPIRSTKSESTRQSKTPLLSNVCRKAFISQPFAFIPKKKKFVLHRSRLKAPKRTVDAVSFIKPLG